MRLKNLVINEIFKSIQGESTYVGYPCTFIRLAGCPLKCKWCDTEYSQEQDQGTTYTIDEIIKKTKKLGSKLVEITGGEPLFQTNTLDLINLLIDNNYSVLLETSGSLSIEPVNKKTHIIMDIKCPDSGMTDHIYWNNLNYIKSTDEIKFVINSRTDFEWAVEVIKKYNLEKKTNILFSNVYGKLDPSTLVDWLLHSSVKARLNMQIHKYIWDANKRGV